LIYEATTDEGDRRAMIDLLMGSLTHGTHKKQNVDSDTVLFEEGTLGLSPDGYGSFSNLKLNICLGISGN